MIDEPLKEQASLFVAGALTASEARDFEGALRQSVELQLFVAELRTSLDAMVAGLPRRTPPPALKSRILREVDARAAVIVPIASGGGSGIWQLFPWALAACLAFLCVVIASRHRSEGLNMLQLQQQIAAAESQIQNLEQDLATQRTNTLAQRDQLHQRIVQQITEQQRAAANQSTRLMERIRELEKRNADLVSKLPPASRPADPAVDPIPDPANPPGVEVVPGGPFGVGGPVTFLGVLRSTQPGSPAIGAAAWEATSQRGTIVIDSLPVPAQGRDYQLWLFVDGAPISAGLLRVDPTGKVQGDYQAGVRIESVQKFAITDERKGGVPLPEGEIIMASN